MSSPTSDSAFAQKGYSAPNKTGFRVVVLVGTGRNSQANKMAVKMARAIINTEVDTIEMIHCVSNDFSCGMAEDDFLRRPFADPAYADCTVYQVLIKGEDATIPETIADYVETTRPDLVIVGSHSLCKSTGRPPSSRASSLNMPLALGAGNAAKAAAQASFALRIVQHVRKVPLLVAKVNSLGKAHTPTGAGVLHAMIDLQSSSRSCLEWMLSRLQPERDSLYLAVTKSVDSQSRAERILTTFGVQCQVNQWQYERRIFKEPPHQCLPKAVQADNIDLVALQAPRCREMSPQILDMLWDLKTCVMLWPPDHSFNTSMHSSSQGLRASMDMTDKASRSTWEVAASNAIEKVDRSSAPASVGRRLLPMTYSSPEDEHISGGMPEVGALSGPVILTHLPTASPGPLPTSAAGRQLPRPNNTPVLSKPPSLAAGMALPSMVARITSLQKNMGKEGQVGDKAGITRLNSGRIAAPNGRQMNGLYASANYSSSELSFPSRRSFN